MRKSYLNRKYQSFPSCIPIEKLSGKQLISQKPHNSFIFKQTFYHNISEEKAKNILNTEEMGTFLVRPWNFGIQSQFFAISLKFSVNFLKVNHN